jgi:hypothetical protein
MALLNINEKCFLNLKYVYIFIFLYLQTFFRSNSNSLLFCLTDFLPILSLVIVVHIQYPMVMVVNTQNRFQKGTY